MMIIQGQIREELKAIINETLDERERLLALQKPMKLYSINQVALRLGRHHSTIKKLVKTGRLLSTNDGRIPETAIEDYLKGQ